MSNDLPEFRPYLFMGLIAFAGAFSHAARWRDPVTNKIAWVKIAVEIPVAFVLGAIAIGVGGYIKADPTVTGGIAGLLGLIGPAAVETVASRWFYKKTGE